MTAPAVAEMFAAMLEGITTGYEERFDFPERAWQPQISYLLASVPRAGSTYLSHLLWRTGCLGAPLEYLNFEPAGPYGFAHGDRAKQVQLWQRALVRRTSPNGVFGLKAFPALLHDLQLGNPALVDEVIRFLLGSGSARKVVRLRRREGDAHAISYARATLSGIWRQEQEEGGRPEPAYSAEAVERAAISIEQQEAAWDAMIRDLQITPLVLWFEDVLEDGKGAAEQVVDYLGITIDPKIEVDIPEIRQQSREGAHAWAEAHAQR
ncbi:Stf0 family sulfotransferase [Alteraurantiacibacter aquimixticola]|uniref:Sulphotransferase Stf0 domain-containing protein n=1 Tax=Alteraurantiacibacter aquimixticola TaxID=2489173 RepID=A0A4T3F3G9_9SPHN|nr:Stf0 family sulfotransferase [Alteraurantiacibacter aquimixticola]TIX50048.1 hypothetical protein E5222_07035 [Alteraurantiacibacter aquimixticola]